MSHAPQPVYYAVHRGRKPGVYLSWPECQQQVNGYKDASFKKFNSYEDALHFWKRGRTAPTGASRNTLQISYDGATAEVAIHGPIERELRRLGILPL